MSAYLDKSQGITFVYSNIYELYKKAKDAEPEAPFAVERKTETLSSRVIKQTESVSKPVVSEFKPKELKGERNFEVPMGVREAEERAMKERAKPMNDLKKNLSEITDAHEKLRFLLQELESLTKK
jgi:hypothetical protein